ncbi:tail fiber domain-containing protein [Thermoproteota archaeon]
MIKLSNKYFVINTYFVVLWLVILQLPILGGIFKLNELRFLWDSGWYMENATSSSILVIDDSSYLAGDEPHGIHTDDTIYYNGSFGVSGNYVIENLHVYDAYITGNITTVSNCDLNNTYFGDAGLGSNWAVFAHRDRTGSTDFAFAQNSTGTITKINKKTGSGSTYTTFSFQAGNAVYFGDSGTLSVNDIPSSYFSLLVNGNISIGEPTPFVIPATFYPHIDGTALYFNGALENSDPIYLKRRNENSNVSSLLMSIGDAGSAQDSLEVGYYSYTTSTWYPVFVFYMDGTHTLPSDIRRKNNIQPLTHVLDKISSVRGIRFHWKTTPFIKRFFLSKQFGFIAQEMEPHFPYMVSESYNSTKMLNYTSTIPILIAGIKEMQANIDENTEMIEELKSEIEAMKGKITEE